VKPAIIINHLQNFIGKQEEMWIVFPGMMKPWKRDVCVESIKESTGKRQKARGNFIF
jgi:hypothetical protein